MIYKLLGAAAMAPGTYAVFRCIGAVVPMKHVRRQAFLGTAIGVCVWLINFTLLPKPTVTLELLNSLIMTAWPCLFVRREQYVQTILTITILIFTQILTVIVVTGIEVFLI